MNILAAIPAANAPVPRFRIGRFARITIDGTHYRWRATDAEGHLLSRADDPLVKERFSHEEFAALVSGDEARAEVDQLFFIGDRPLDEPFGAGLLADLPDWKAEKARFLADLCDAFRARQADDRSLNLGDRGLAKLMPELRKDLARLWEKEKSRPGPGGSTFKLPSPRHFRRIYKLYAAHGYSPAALADQCRGGNRTSTVAPHDAELRMRFALRYASPNRPTMARIYGDLLAYIETTRDERREKELPPYRIPGRRTFEKLVRSLDPFWTDAKREGLKAAKEKHRMDGRGVRAEAPLERGEMDDWEVHLQTLLAYARVWDTLSPEEKEAVARTRLWMTACVDVATRSILALRFSNQRPSTATALEALEMTLVDKTHIAMAAGAESPWDQRGPFETLVTDAGSNFKSWEFRNALSDLGTEFLIPPAGEANLRPFVESVFKSLDQRFLGWFTGRTFSDFLAKGEYDAQDEATVCADALNAHLVRAVVDIYHNTPHSGLGGETPRNAWLRGSAKHGLLPSPHPRTRRLIFGLRLFRPIGDQGIRVLGLSYESEELQLLRKRTGAHDVEIRVDRLDLSEISVKRPDGKWLQVSNRFGLPGGVSVWEWAEAAKRLSDAHARNTAVTYSVAMRAINELRESGDALAARAEFGAATLSDKHIAAVERQQLRNLAFENRRDDETEVTLSPLERGQGSLLHGIQLLPGVQGDLQVPEPEDEPARPFPREVTSQFGSADDISFDD